ncbi:MAG: ferrous iron transport protein B [Arcanobacterium sp.]
MSVNPGRRKRLGISVAQRQPPTHTIALVGNPNVGKSTVFNRITGSTQAVVNAPGTTVDVMRGLWQELNVAVLDLPGTYSLVPNSPDEKVVADALSGEASQLGGADGIDLVLAVLDGSALTRSLYLLAQLAQAGKAVAAIVTMADVAAAEGRTINPTVLAREIGVPVMIVDPRADRDCQAMVAFVRDALRDLPRVQGIDPDPTAPGYSEPVGRGRGRGKKVHHGTGKGHGGGGKAHHGTGCGCPGCDCDYGIDEKCLCLDENCREDGSHVVPLELPVFRDKIQDKKLSETVPELKAPTPGTPEYSDNELQRATKLFSWVERVEEKIADAVVVDPKKLSRSDKIDRVLLNPVAGIAALLGIMWFLFKLAGEWVGPLQDLFDGWFTDTEPGAISLANGFAIVLEALGWDGGWLEAVLVGGLATGLGVVASFVPLMFVIFAAISVLEDSGYMARVAFLGDRLMRKIGLDGRVILPLIMGFGCNLPSLAAAKTLPSTRQRLVTVLITPYTSCAARLTIYLMIARIFFPDNAGTVVFAMYVLSLIMVVLGAWILKFFITRDEVQAPLMLILPAYQVPRVGVLLGRAVRNSWMFIKGAGKIIVAMTMVVWLLGAVPMGNGAGDAGFADPELPMEYSAYGQVAKVLEPVFEPAGFGDWHMTGALMTGFVAKETVVSSIVASYNMDPEAAGDAEDNGSNLGVLPVLLDRTFTETAGEGLQGVGALAFLVFVLTYTPCLATVGEQARLIGGKLTAISVVVQLVVAWALAVAVFQLGALIVG